jgi:hypothetical protein
LGIDGADRVSVVETGSTRRGVLEKEVADCDATVVCALSSGEEKVKRPACD